MGHPTKKITFGSGGGHKSINKLGWKEEEKNLLGAALDSNGTAAVKKHLVGGRTSRRPEQKYQKWLSTSSSGIPGYIMVVMALGKD